MEKTANGIMIYLQEELGDARLRAQQLGVLIKAATDLVEKSTHRDHFYEVAGHLLYGIPDTVFKLSKALDAVALAAAKLDYEEIRQGLKPEKVEELENALDDVRLRYLKRRSNEETMNTTTVAEILNTLADETDATGHVPVAKLARLIGRLERGAKRASNQPKRASATFRAASEYLKAAVNPSRVTLAQNLRRILAESQMDPPVAGAGEEFQKENPKITDEEVEKINEEHEKNKDNFKEGRFEQGKPADPTQNMSEEDAQKWKEMNDEYRDVVKDLHKQAAVSPKDKKVLDAFLDQKAMEGSKLSTDGKKLDGNWMGGNGIAVWSGDKIQFNDLGSKAAQEVQNALKKLAPANWLK